MTDNVHHIHQARWVESKRLKDELNEVLCRHMIEEHIAIHEVLGILEVLKEEIWRAHRGLDD